MNPFATAIEIATAIREKKVSARAVVAAHLERIERLNGSINAIVTRADDAVERAEAVDRGDVKGPLAGVPFTLKDAHWTKGIRTTLGAPPFKDNVPTFDGTAVTRLREAGAILLGKTNVPPMLMSAQTDNPIFGRTKNPWNLERTVGGSSGGAGAAVAAGLSAFDIGSDMSGSIRMPAHFCGIYGLKPTTNRLPSTGHMAIEGMTRFDRFLGVVGPMARSVADLELLTRILAGPDGSDLEIPPVPWRDVPRRNVGELRIAFRPSFAGVRTARSIVDCITRATKTLASAGAQLEECDPFDVELKDKAWDLAMKCLGAAMRELFGASLPAGGPPPPVVSVVDGIRMLEARDRVIVSADTALEGFDAFLSPVSITPAFLHSPPKSPIEVDGEAIESRFVDHYLYPWNLTGHPAVVIPAGFSEEGLPIGLQLVGRRFQDEELLAVAACIDEALGAYKPPPL